MTTLSIFGSRTPQIFWGEMAPCEHIVQIYGDETVFADALEGFVSAGLEAGESAIVIATQAHLDALDARMRALDVDLERARLEDRYIAVRAEEMLKEFMVQSWPDEARFKEAVGGLIARARKDDRKVRAFGEMVAVLWAQGHVAATVHLEWLWNRLCREERFPLFCAYPKMGLEKEAVVSIGDVCAAHSRVFYT